MAQLRRSRRKKNRFWIAQDILYDGQPLSQAELATYVCLCMRADNATQSVRSSQRTIALTGGLSPHNKVVSRALKKLEALDLIRIQRRRGGRTNIYTLVKRDNVRRRIWIDNELLDHVADVGTLGVLAYIVLAKHANNETQQCWPSLDLMGRILRAKRGTVGEAVKTLQRDGLIRIDKRPCSRTGRLQGNLYTLYQPEERPVPVELLMALYGSLDDRTIEAERMTRDDYKKMLEDYDEERERALREAERDAEADACFDEDEAFDFWNDQLRKEQAAMEGVADGQ
jgi:predicted transcriptional regulator